MNNMNDAPLKQQLSYFILNHIVEKILECFNLMREDCERDSIKIRNNEIIICDYLYQNYLNNDSIMEQVGFNDFRFFREVPENYQNGKPSGRTDFQVISIEQFRHRKRYFIIECKRIDGNLTLNRKYIFEGIRRFVGNDPLYSSYFGSNGMIGFVVKNIDINQNVNRINQLLKQEYPEIIVQAYLDVGSIPQIYVSSHSKKGINEITLLHAFPNCVSIVD